MTTQDSINHSQAQLVMAEEGEELATSANRLRIVLDGEKSGGALTLFEYTLGVGGITPPPHRHTFAEIFYVLEGSVTFRLDGQQVTASAGSTVHIPGGVSHAFGNDSGAPARFLIVAAPAGIENYFRELKGLVATLPPGPPDMKQLGPRIGALMREHGIEPVEG
ncbi:MAG TPA: cupin domain-containing protein [Candidatus Sulfomarinibacteraceae bacterium]|nr:cupin domain-containing protein [Candidatus Sulfomarinibacteraceae bacterium]